MYFLLFVLNVKVVIIFQLFEFVIIVIIFMICCLRIMDGFYFLIFYEGRFLYNQIIHCLAVVLFTPTNSISMKLNHSIFILPSNSLYSIPPPSTYSPSTPFYSFSLSVASTPMVSLLTARLIKPDSFRALLYSPASMHPHYFRRSNPIAVH